MDSKSDLRKYAKILRNSLDIKTISHFIVNNFRNTDIYKKSKNIAAFYPHSSEVDITSIFEDTEKNFFLPKMNKDDSMGFYNYKLGDELIKNKYGIAEPNNDIVSCDFDLMIIPALMADRNGYRLGYGKGCYDKYLANTSNDFCKVVLIPEDLVVEKLPNDEFDIPVNLIVTEKIYMKC